MLSTFEISSEYTYCENSSATPVLPRNNQRAHGASDWKVFYLLKLFILCFLIHKLDTNWDFLKVNYYWFNWIIKVLTIQRERKTLVPGFGTWQEWLLGCQFVIREESFIFQFYLSIYLSSYLSGKPTILVCRLQGLLGNRKVTWNKKFLAFDFEGAVSFLFWKC